jgi:hypothetical protein
MFLKKLFIFRKLVLLKLEKGLSFGDILLDGTIPDVPDLNKASKEVLSSTIFNHVMGFSPAFFNTQGNNVINAVVQY